MEALGKQRQQYGHEVEFLLSSESLVHLVAGKLQIELAEWAANWQRAARESNIWGIFYELFREFLLRLGDN